MEIACQIGGKFVLALQVLAQKGHCGVLCDIVHCKRIPDRVGVMFERGEIQMGRARPGLGWGGYGGCCIMAGVLKG